jgi:hypothetical protein
MDLPCKRQCHRLQPRLAVSHRLRHLHYPKVVLPEARATSGTGATSPQRRTSNNQSNPSECLAVSASLPRVARTFPCQAYHSAHMSPGKAQVNSGVTAPNEKKQDATCATEAPFAVSARRIARTWGLSCANPIQFTSLKIDDQTHDEVAHLRCSSSSVRDSRE